MEIVFKMEVLLIDDNKEITEMISFFLDSQGILCEVENDAKKALEKINEKQYDVILLDLTMPVFSGFDLFNQLKKENYIRKNNIVIFTASYIEQEKIDNMIKDGIKAIIRKPISIDSIINTINKFK
jgi:two-component system OmpR family response regulator